MQLVVVESPTKTKSLSKYLGDKYQVLASMGHLRDLPKSKTGVEIVKKGKGFEFRPEYEISKTKSAQVKKLQTAAKKAESIILATDPDREGEAIAYHVAQLLKGPKVTFQRVAFHSITKDAILEAMAHPRELDMDLVDSQQARRVLDRLVGYRLSPVLWKKVRRGLSAGRVQSVAVRLIVEREREISAFKPDEYWEIKVLVNREQGTGNREQFWIDLIKVDGKAAKVSNEGLAKEIESGLKKASYVVEAVERKERKAQPHPPFKTSTLQQAAANVLGWSAKKTMSVAQNLYESGSITYHRTDSLNLAESAVATVRKFISKEFGEKYLPTSPIYYKTSGKVVAQEAHEAIRPADMEVGTNSFKGEGKMADDQEKLYGLIWRRTIACQMMAAVYDNTKIKVKAGKYDLQAIGEIMKFDGWRKLYKKQFAEGAEDGEQVLPEVKDGDKLDYKDLSSLQKFTLPPARYNDASLVKELEKRGIGRPSTYASIISTIIDRNYVNREQRRFFATSVGMAVTDFLVANFPVEMEYDFTAKMEDELDEIARGKLNWNKMLSDFYEPFEEKVTKAESADTKRVEVPVEKTGEKCPECKEGEIVIREGRFGRFKSCSTFPECKYTGKIIEYFEGMLCPKDGGRIVVKKTRFGKPFYGCENYPKCDWASWKKPEVEGAAEAGQEKAAASGPDKDQG